MRNAGSSAGAAVAIPLVSVISLQFNWQASFVVTGLLGLIWVFFWRRQYYLPQDHPRISEAERELILDGQPPQGPTAEKTSIWRLLRMRKAWGCLCAQIGRAHVELQSLMRIAYAVFCLNKKQYMISQKLYLLILT